MPRTIAIILCAAALVRADDPPKPSPAGSPAPVAAPEFKLVWASVDVADDPLVVFHMFASRGKVYEFRDASNETVVYDLEKKVIHVLDLKLKTKARITCRELDDRVEKIRREAAASAAELEKQKGRADRIAGANKRSLVEPRFQARFDESTHRLKLTNPNVEIDAVGVHEDDPARFAILREVLLEAAKLRTVRKPSDLRQFAEIDTLSSMLDEHKLRPTELTFLFRLAGRPEKFRGIFRLVPAIPDTEQKFITGAEALLNGPAQPMSLDRFDRQIDPDDLRK